MKITRLVALLLFALSALGPSRAAAQEKTAAKGPFIAYIGTYTTKTSSQGIYTVRYDRETGRFSKPEVATPTVDPSFLAVHPNGKFLYAVNEAGKASLVSAFRIDQQTGGLTALNQVPALGDDPCYIAFDRTGRFVFVANYGSGSVAVFPVGQDGKLGAQTALVTDAGSLGPVKDRQEGPHAHWVEATPDNRFVLVSDLGLDQVLVFKFDARTGALTPNQPAFVKVKPGTGPRHAAFHPNGKFVFVVGELNSTATSYALDAKKGSLKEIGSVSTLPPGYSGRNDVAELAVHPNGKFLYVSNRGNDSIAILSIDPEKGRLAPVGGIPTGGKEPRHFTFDPTGKFLVVENQLSDTVALFRVDPATGQLESAGDAMSVPSPVCLVFASPE